MDFIGREQEMRILQDQYDRVEHPFVIIKGRRRVGKSRLIKEFCKDKDALYFQADKEDANAILFSFCNKLSEELGIQIGKMGSWKDAIELYIKYSNDKRRILIIDEFQYITKSDRNAEKEFQSIWDNIISESNTMFIISGSYRTMMEDLTKYDRPLYGRNTCDLFLRPLDFRKCIFDNDYRYAVERYAFTGGIPHYMSLFDSNKSVMDNIISLTMDMGGPLVNEVPYLMSDEFKDVKSCNTYLRTISSGYRKMEDICSALQIKSQDASPYLNKMVKAGLLERRIPITDNLEKSRNGLYVVSDRFMSFWFKFVYQYRNDIILGMNDGSVSNLRSHFIDRHVSYIFEDICREELRRYLKEKGVVASYGSFWSNGKEIDIVAKDDVNGTIYVGECKYHNSPVDHKLLVQLESKCTDVKEFRGYRIVFCIFSASGFSDGLLSEIDRDDLMLFDCGERLIDHGQVIIDHTDVNDSTDRE